ncbi:hypothetical protein BDM02DRAFT_1295588 [Thelephora ganbajun]|uniref:Uncharacterized protein n=1 Tax=Thelephora ganbajun TaxID=370292 RepID=A0ACB6ZM14_THEGA|nr:hypothetical protein BDM02DRAFT_1295588 [Thelephora ganbajun]
MSSSSHRRRRIRGGESKRKEHVLCKHKIVAPLIFVEKNSYHVPFLTSPPYPLRNEYNYQGTIQEKKVRICERNNNEKKVMIGRNWGPVLRASPYSCIRS